MYNKKQLFSNYLNSIVGAAFGFYPHIHFHYILYGFHHLWISLFLIQTVYWNVPNYMEIAKDFLISSKEEIQVTNRQFSNVL